MSELVDIKETVDKHYALNIGRIELNRDGGSLSYIIHADNKKLFLRVIRPEFMDTALQSIDIHLYLSQSAFSVPPIILTKDGKPYVLTGDKGNTKLYVMYEFINGQEPRSGDAEKVGHLVGRFHTVMRGYTGELAIRDKHFFVGRYVEILKKKNYPKTDVFNEVGDMLWERVKNLPRGYCHGDLYRGNVLQDGNGTLYILDLDTCCNAFPIYDAVLFCNETNYFDYRSDGLKKTKKTFASFLNGYSAENAFSDEEIAAFGDLMAIYHFQVQATVIEIYGLDCVDVPFIDKQLNWILRWLNQCEGERWV